MTTKGKDALREELRMVEEDLERLRATARELRERLGEHADAPTDAAEIATMLTMAEEQEAFAATLEARREELLQRLAET
jgi:hypothetical protein